MTKQKEQKPQTIESLKLDAMKVSHRYQMAIAILVFSVLGVIGGHFLSVNITSDAQAKVVNSIQLTAQVKN